MEINKATFRNESTDIRETKPAVQDGALERIPQIKGSDVNGPSPHNDIPPELDAWLIKNGYNQYGDPVGTMYMGGTPLFDESTGLTRSRIGHIYSKLPFLKALFGNCHRQPPCHPRFPQFPKLPRFPKFPGLPVWFPISWGRRGRCCPRHRRFFPITLPRLRPRIEIRKPERVVDLYTFDFRKN